MILLIIGIIFFTFGIWVIFYDKDLMECILLCFAVSGVSILVGVSFVVPRIEYTVTSMEKQGSLYEATIMLDDKKEIVVALSPEQAKFYQENPVGKISQEHLDTSYEIKIQQTEFKYKENRHYDD